MRRSTTLFPTLTMLLTCSGLALPASADSTKAWCSLFSAKDNSKALPEPLRCTFSQRQGNVVVSMPQRTFNFPAKEQGKTYQRDNHSSGVGFSKAGEFTLVIFWQDPRLQ